MLISEESARDREARKDREGQAQTNREKKRAGVFMGERWSLMEERGRRCRDQVVTGKQSEMKRAM